MDSMVESYDVGTMERLQCQTFVTKDKFIRPLVEILGEVTPKPSIEHVPSTKPSTSLTTSLDALFPEQEYEQKDLQKAKAILGSLSEKFTPQELKDLIVQVQFLTESWLDEFERDIFNGLTLRELLHERGGQ